MSALLHRMIYGWHHYEEAARMEGKKGRGRQKGEVDDRTGPLTDSRQHYHMCIIIAYVLYVLYYLCKKVIKETQ